MYSIKNLFEEIKEALNMQKEVREDIRELMNYLLASKQDLESYRKLKEIDKKLGKTL